MPETNSSLLSSHVLLSVQGILFREKLFSYLGFKKHSCDCELTLADSQKLFTLLDFLRPWNSDTEKKTQDSIINLLEYYEKKELKVLDKKSIDWLKNISQGVERSKDLNSILGLEEANLKMLWKIEDRSVTLSKCLERFVNNSSIFMIIEHKHIKLEKDVKQKVFVDIMREWKDLFEAWNFNTLNKNWTPQQLMIEFQRIVRTMM